jgi:D-3-phosphoglycerate dehydrogenase
MKIAIVEPLGIPNQELVSLITEAAPSEQLEIVTFDNRLEDEESLIARSAGADIVVVSNIKYPASVMEQCPNLKYLCVAFTGYDHIDMAYARERGIQVSNCAGYSTTAVAELAIAFAIDLARNVVPLNQAVRQGGTKAGFVGPELEGKRFGIIGAGAIGSRVAKLANAFDCEVVTYSRTKKDLPGVTFVELDELLATSDFVSVHVPQNPQTVGMIGAEQFALMKSSAYFINCARGPIVDSQALADALNEGCIAGAAVDVFESEPPIAADHPLLSAKNLIATPHIAFASYQAFAKRGAIIAHNIASYLAGEPDNLVG